MYKAQNISYITAVASLCVVFAVLVAACRNDMESSIRIMQAANPDICVPDMKLVLPMHYRDSLWYSKRLEEECFKFVVYADSSECMSCMTGKLHGWDSFLAKLRIKENVIPIFIFSPKKDEMESIEVSLLLERLNFPVFIDTGYVFVNSNKFIPENPLFHTFLVDKNNHIILIGDPRRNRKVEELFDSYTRDK